MKKKFWEGISINKILYIQREDREHDFEAEKEEIIINAYGELVLKSADCCIIRNDKKIEDVIRDVIDEMGK